MAVIFKYLLSRAVPAAAPDAKRRAVISLFFVFIVVIGLLFEVLIKVLPLYYNILKTGLQENYGKRKKISQNRNVSRETSTVENEWCGTTKECFT